MLHTSWVKKARARRPVETGSAVIAQTHQIAQTFHSASRKTGYDGETRLTTQMAQFAKFFPIIPAAPRQNRLWSVAG